MRKNIIKVCSLMLIISSLILSITGCMYLKYRGDYPDLCTVAWCNVPTIDGHGSNGEATYDAEVEVLDTDQYGRTLFSYHEQRGPTLALVMQYRDNNTVYYYPDDCYIFISSYSYDDEYDAQEIQVDPSSEEISILKSLNDWNLPINENKCEKSEILKRKATKDKLKIKDHQFETVIEKYYADSNIYVNPRNVSFVRYSNYLMSDSYGREMHVIYTDFEEHYDKHITYYSYIFLAVFDPDENCFQKSVTLIDDPMSPSQYVKAAKKASGWNTPLN